MQSQVLARWPWSPSAWTWWRVGRELLLSHSLRWWLQSWISMIQLQWHCLSHWAKCWIEPGWFICMHLGFERVVALKLPLSPSQVWCKLFNSWTCHLRSQCSCPKMRKPFEISAFPFEGVSDKPHQFWTWHCDLVRWWIVRPKMECQELLSPAWSVWWLSLTAHQVCM